ncbi:TIGR02450 family Trp-rich protein [Janthinobacterium sp.]|uniref:TIGR02450 family Trp-rich protein n=1 Tax=Janthinobacterium sp. TaxID=1871054 RepID=UPI0028A0B3DF|nr:TIGR02450 family Trp-rich protein [Janthinobacterium sp.]
MNLPARNPLNANKLMHSKWTAVAPVNKEKHFIVIKVGEPATPGAPVTDVELQAVHSQRVQVLPWRALRDASAWRQGWV